MLKYNYAKFEVEYKTKSNVMDVMVEGLKNIIKNSRCDLEGNVFYDGADQNLSSFTQAFHPKRVNLFWCGKRATNRICEIGFNAGHSSMLMLMGAERNNITKYTIFDDCSHSYTIPSLEYLRTKFDVNLDLIDGDSMVTVPTWVSKNQKVLGTYDLVHVDGSHSFECVRSDMAHADILLKKNGIIVVNDTDIKHINDRVNAFIESGRYAELTIVKSRESPHRIIQKLDDRI